MNFILAMTEACRILGLEPERVTHLAIDMKPDRLALSVELYPTEEQLRRIVELIAEVPPEQIRRHDDRVDVAVRIVRDALEEKSR